MQAFTLNLFEECNEYVDNKCPAFCLEMFGCKRDFVPNGRIKSVS